MPLYLGSQDFLHRIRVIKDHKSKVGQFSTDTFGIDSQFHNVSVG